MTRRRSTRPQTPPLEFKHDEWIGNYCVREYRYADSYEIVVTINNMQTEESFESAVARVKAADGKPVEPARLPTRAEYEAMTKPKTFGESLRAFWRNLKAQWRQAGVYNSFKADGAADPWAATKHALYLEENYLIPFKIYASTRRMHGQDLASSREAFLTYRTGSLSSQDRVHVREALNAMDEDEAFLPDAKALHDKETADLMARLQDDIKNLPMTPTQRYIYQSQVRA